MRSAVYWIERLRLVPHPEGGFYREIFRSRDVLSGEGLPVRFPGPRNAATCIYYLLDGEAFSAFHRIKSDELWHFHAGDPLNLVVLHPAGTSETIRLGSDTDQQWVGVVPAGHWFGARCTDPEGYSLMACTVAPGFSFEDFEMARREELMNAYPDHQNLILQLTRE